MRDRLTGKIVGLFLSPINPNAPILIGLFTIAWGLWVIAPWDVFSSAAAFNGFHRLSPEWVWGAISIFAGLLTTAGVVLENLALTKIGLQVCEWFWLIVSIMFFLGDPQNTGGVTYLFICLIATYMLINTLVCNPSGRKNQL